MNNVIPLAEHRRSAEAAQAARLQWAHDAASNVLGILGDMRIPFGDFARFLRRVERCGGPDRAAVLELASMLVESRLAACSQRSSNKRQATGRQLQLPMAHCPCFTGPATTTTCANPPSDDREDPA